MNAATPTVHVSPPWPLDEFLSRQGLILTRHEDRRRYARLYYRHPATLHLTTSLPAFSRPDEQASTYSCDISRSGVAFLSPAELYPLETVQLEITGLGWRTVCVSRCRRLAPGCYEIGATFESPIASLPRP